MIAFNKDDFKNLYNAQIYYTQALIHKHMGDTQGDIESPNWEKIRRYEEHVIYLSELLEIME